VRKILALGWASAISWLAVTGACTTNSLTAKGGACFQSIDCQAGLVCINANDAGGVCTDDLTGIVSVPEAGSPDAVAQPDAPADVTVQDVVTQDVVAQDVVTQDVVTQDTGTPDTGTTTDAGTD
jgi:hypothetical protein